MEKKRYAVLTAFTLPNGQKAAKGATVELTREQAKYLLHGGKIVDAAAPAPAQKPAKAPKAPKPEEPKGE